MAANHEQREAFISPSMTEVWFTESPSGLGGMNPPVNVNSGKRLMGKVPELLDNKIAKYHDKLFDTQIACSPNVITGSVCFPEYMGFGNVPMFVAGFSPQGTLHWIAHRSPGDFILSIGFFKNGQPHDGFFLMDRPSMKLIATPDISNHYVSDFPPSMGLVELIDGKVVGMLSLGEDAYSVVNKYLSTKPEIKACLP